MEKQLTDIVIFETKRKGLDAMFRFELENEEV